MRLSAARMTKQMFVAVATFAALTSARAQEPAMDLQCELRIDDSLRGAQPAEITFILTNAGSRAVQVLNWHTPFEGVKAAMFDITRDRETVDYQGRMLKRGNPRKQDYFVLRPGESKEARIDLADGWNVTAPGTYTIHYSAELFDVAPGDAPVPRTPDQFNPVVLNCNRVTFDRDP